MVGTRPDEKECCRLENRCGAVEAAHEVSFIAATSVLPSEISTGASAKLIVNGRPALTFTLGLNRDFTWKEGAYQLKYLSKRIEFPYFGSHRQFEPHGNSGIYQLTVPADAVEPGQPVLLQVEFLSFPQWNNGWFMVKERRGHAEAVDGSSGRRNRGAAPGHGDRQSADPHGAKNLNRIRSERRAGREQRCITHGQAIHAAAFSAIPNAPATLSHAFCCAGDGSPTTNVRQVSP